MNISSKQIQNLINNEAAGPKISIYIPTHPVNNIQTIEQDKTRFKNALKDIKNNIKYDEEKLGVVLNSLYDMLDDIELWEYQDVSLAVFADKHGIEYYRLPYETTEAAYIEDQFIVSPMGIMHSIGINFYVLDINLTKPRLLKSRHGTLTEVILDKMPKSFEDTFSRDEYRNSLQNLAAPRGSGGDNQIHGHGPEDSIKEDTSKYIVLIADTIDEYLRDQDLPLLIVGEESRVGNLRKHISYKNLLDDKIDGNFENYTPQKLYESAIEKIEDYDSKRRDDKVKKFLGSDPKFIVSGNTAISEAAEQKRVETLFIPSYIRTKDSIRFGNYDSIILQLPSEMEELEAVTRKVLSQAGTVQAVAIDVYPEIDQPKALCRF